MGASGPHEASWGIHGNLIGVSWGPHEGSWGHHDSSWGALWGLRGDLMRLSWGLMATLGASWGLMKANKQIFQ